MMPGIETEAAIEPAAKTRLAPLPAWLWSLILLVVFLLIWEAYVRLFNVNAFILPPPSGVIATWIVSLGLASTWANTWITAIETLLGFVIAAVLGVGLGAILGKRPELERILNPFIVSTQVVPKVALVPLFVVWFGFGLTSKVLIAAVLAIFPILVNTTLGIKSVAIPHREVMVTLNASRWQTFTQLEFRSALPYILTGMEMGVVLSIIGAVVGEYLGGNTGLGSHAVKQMNGYDTAGLFATIIHLSVLGFVFYAAVVACRRFAIPWHESILNAKKP